MMMVTQTVKSIDRDGLQGWIADAVQPLFPGKQIQVLPRKPFDATGESSFFCAIDTEFPFPVADLPGRAVEEYSGTDFVYFYADDLINAAVGNGDLEPGYYHLDYRW